MQHLSELWGDRHELWNVRRNTSEHIKQRGIDASTKYVLMQANRLNLVYNTTDDLHVSICDDPDDTVFIVTHKLVYNEPDHKNLKYTNKKGNIPVDMLNHLNDIRKLYNVPPAFTSRDSLPAEMRKTRVEKHLA